jgi:hypothetical protein
MGPAVLITLGLLFLLANLPEYPFERTWPILLIVIGAIKVLGYALPGREHRNPGQYPPPYQAPYPGAGQSGAGQSGAGPYEAGAKGPVITPPPTPSAGALGDGSGESNEVHNG